MHIKFEDLKPKFIDQSERWNDAYIGVNFNHEGKDYFITLVFNEGTLMGRSANRLKVNTGPLSLKTDGDIQVLEKQGSVIDIVKIQREPTFTHKIENDKVIMEQEELKDKYRIQCPHCDKMFNKYYLPRHINNKHNNN